MTFHVTDAFRPVTLGMQSFEAARLGALRLVGPIDRSETVSLDEALGRVLAETIVAPCDLPAFDQAAMDGYAVRFADVAVGPLRVDGVTHAGDAPTRLAPKCAHRIMTGASLPAGADTVVPYEETITLREGLAMPGSIKPEGNIRRAGEDIARGETVLTKGRRLAWPEIAALAALGIGSVRVTAPIRVSLLTTGAELRSAGEALPAAGIYDSNGPMLAARMLRLGAEPTLLAAGPDDPAALAGKLARLLAEYPLVITTGGVSVGDRDYLPRPPKRPVQSCCFTASTQSPAPRRWRRGKTGMSCSASPATLLPALRRLSCWPGPHWPNCRGLTLPPCG